MTIILPAFGMDARAANARNADRFNSSCFSYSCLTAFALTFKVHVTRNGSINESNSVREIIKENNYYVLFPRNNS